MTTVLVLWFSLAVPFMLAAGWAIDRWCNPRLPVKHDGDLDTIKDAD